MMRILVFMLVTGVVLVVAGLLYLGSREDFATEVVTVQQSAINRIGNSGEARPQCVGVKVVDYVASELAPGDPAISWSAERLSQDDGSAEVIQVTATAAPQDPIVKEDSIELQFTLDRVNGQIAFVAMSIDGSPVSDTAGNPRKLAAAIRFLLEWRLNYTIKTMEAAGFEVEEEDRVFKLPEGSCRRSERRDNFTFQSPVVPLTSE